MTPQTVVEVLEQRAALTPNAVAFRSLELGESEAGVLTYATLFERQRAVAEALRELRERPVLLLFSPGLEFVTTFFGCLSAGALPIAVPPPLPTERTERMHLIVADADAQAVLTTAAFEPLLREWSALDERLKALPVLTSEQLEQASPAPTSRRPVPNDRAFLQYTSGSTSVPRGVELRHRHLSANLDCIARTTQLKGDSVCVTWLPIFHDMGLINGVLAPVWAGAQSVMMSPLDFIRRPGRWLEAISQYGGTHSGAPNFAYDLCVRRVPLAERAGLSLKSWRQAYVSAEPIHADTLDRFTRAFAPQGFRESAFYPCYGLAEATLAVTGGALESPPVRCTVERSALDAGRAVEVPDETPDAVVLVGCGSAGIDTDVVVVDPERRAPVANGTVGEVWVSGPSVADGYFRKPEATSDVFGAKLFDGRGPFLRTGDLGFLREGELFVVGRTKDVLVIRGRKYHPHDLEWAVKDAHPALRAGCAAAFTVGADEPKVVLVHEVRPDHEAAAVEAAIGAIRQTVSEQFALHVHRVVLVGPGGVPRTSSGKIQRRRARELFETGGSLAVLAQG